VHSIRHSRTSGVVHTLAANEQQRAAKLASNRALDHKRHDVVETLYNLKRAHRNLLAEAWHEETVPTVPAPPRLIAVSMTKRMEEGDLGHLSTRPASAPPLHDRHRPWSARSTARVGSASLARAGSARRAVAHAHVPPSQACRAPRSLLTSNAYSRHPTCQPPSEHRRRTTSPPRFVALSLDVCDDNTPSAGVPAEIGAPPAAFTYSGHAPDTTASCVRAGVSESVGIEVDELTERVHAGTVSSAAEKHARARRQRSLRARRILREAVRLKAREMSTIKPGKLSADEFHRLVKVAVELRKAGGVLSRTELLHDLGEIQLSMLVSSGKLRKYARYSTLFHEGSASTSFYILTGGCIRERSLRGADCYHTVHRGPHSSYFVFGMDALLGRPRSSSVQAITNVDVIRFSATGLNISTDGAAKVAKKVFDLFVEGELSHMALFSNINARQLKQIVPLFSLEEHPAGTPIFAAGMPGDKIYIIMHGAVDITKGGSLLTRLQAEQGQAATSEKGLPVFGEMAIIDRQPRIANAVASL
jgi:CRP-like cAMP-binding protein